MDMLNKKQWSIDGWPKLVFENNPAKEGIVSGLDKTLLQALADFLGSFKVAVKQFKVSKIPTIHTVYCMYVGLLRPQGPMMELMAV
eukprot:4163761-Ditylum_brightwellii.AAC.1